MYLCNVWDLEIKATAGKYGKAITPIISIIIVLYKVTGKNTKNKYLHKAQFHF